MNFDIIKQEIPLHQVCASYGLKLKKSGGNLTACCPFHEESTPSFYVYPDNHFHCFGCDKHGTILDFVALSEHCDLYEAGRKLCEKFNPNLLDADDNEIEKAIKYRKERENRTALEEKKALVTAVYNLCDKLHNEGNDMTAQSFEAALANNIYGCDELYSCLIHNGETATANQILGVYHPEFKEEPKRGRGRPAKEALTSQSFAEWLDLHGYSLRLNLITHRVEVDGISADKCPPERLSENLEVILYDELKAEYSCNMNLIFDLVKLVADRNAFNPVLEILDTIPEWDGRDRLEDIYVALHIPKDDSLSRILIRKFCIMAISLQKNGLACNPFGADGALVLDGDQGYGKTRFCRFLSMTNLFPVTHGLFKEGVQLTSDKDSEIAATSAWIVELGELGGTTSKKDRDALKVFITREIDEIRPHYGRKAVSNYRRSIFIGTVNDQTFLNDPTGSRRWWVVDITQPIDFKILDCMDIIQFWKQIQKYSDEDIQSFRLTPEEREAVQKRNGIYEKPIPAEDEINDIFAKVFASPQDFKWYWITTSDFIHYYERLTKYSVVVIGRALKKIMSKYNCDTAERFKKDPENPEVRERHKYLPIPKRAFVYGSPSEIPPEERATLADDALKIAQEGLKQ